MRLLMLHVDRFASRVTERGRSAFFEAAEPPEVEVGEALVVLAAAEKGDEMAVMEVAGKTASEVAEQAGRVGARVVVLHPFAHLFADLAPPEAAVDILTRAAAHLAHRGLAVHRTPFGWFNTLELSAKGHPLSRVARAVRPQESGPRA